MRNVVRVSYAGGNAWRFTVRGHHVLTDQPVNQGGDDTGPTPTELFIASLVTCMGYYASRFLNRNSADPTGLELVASYEMSEDRPARVKRVAITVEVPRHLPLNLIEPLRRVMDHCTVHNTLREGTRVDVELRPAREEVA